MSKILIIEDDTYLRQLLEKKLKSKNYKVFSVVDAKTGFEILKKEEINLILLDLILPGLSGYDFLKKIKSDEKLKSIPVIVISNLGQYQEIEKALKLGASDYLIKANFTPNEILEKAEKFIKK